MSQTLLTNSLCIVGIILVGVLQHFGFVDSTASTIVYAALPAYMVGSGTLKVTPSAPVFVRNTNVPTSSVSQSPINSSRG